MLIQVTIKTDQYDHHDLNISSIIMINIILPGTKHHHHLDQYNITRYVNIIMINIILPGTWYNTSSCLSYQVHVLQPLNQLGLSWLLTSFTLPPGDHYGYKSWSRSWLKHDSVPDGGECDIGGEEEEEADEGKEGDDQGGQVQAWKIFSTIWRKKKWSGWSGQGLENVFNRFQEK